MRLASIVGARPQFIKLSAVSAAIRQHYDYTLEQYGIAWQSHVRCIEIFGFTAVV